MLTEPQPHVCQICGSPELVTRIRCAEHMGIHRRENARVDGFTRYEDDVECQRFVAEHPDGASLEDIADAVGLVRERVRQIEEAALAKLAKRMKVAGICAQDAFDYLAGRARARDAGPWE